jgi:hypothetical protein
MRKTIILAALISASVPALADVERIGVHLGTVHQVDGFNNVNPGVYAVWQGGATVGTYYNSERNQTAYIGWTWDRGPFAITAAALTGYKRAPVVPGLIPSVRVPIGDRAAARVSFILAPEKQGRAVHISMEWAL